MLTANLPPTLAKSQVSSVRKNLKLHLVSVLKHPCSLEFQAQISTLLLDLGMPQSEITRSTPAPREPRKRPRHEQYTEGKKVKIGEWLLECLSSYQLCGLKSVCFVICMPLLVIYTCVSFRNDNRSINSSIRKILPILYFS